MQTKKKRATTTKLVSLLLAIVLVASMVPALAFAGGEEQPIVPATEEGAAGAEGTGIGEETPAPETEAGGPEGSEPGTGEGTEAGEEELLQGETSEDLGIAAASEIAPMAEVDGDDSLTVKVGTLGTGFVDVDSIGNAQTWPMSDPQRQLQITAVFSEQDSPKTRTLEVNIPRGYKILEYTAKHGVDLANVTELGWSDMDNAKVASSVLSLRDGSDWNSAASANKDNYVRGYTNYYTDGETPYRLYDGKILYTFNSNADQIVITLTLALDQTILSHTATTHTLDNVTVKQVSGSKVLNETLSTTVSELSTNSMRAVSTNMPESGPSRNIEGVVDDDPDLGTIDVFHTGIVTSAGSPGKPASGNNYNNYVDLFKITVSYPKGINFRGFSTGVVGTINAQTDDSGGIYANGHLKVDVDSSARTVTFTFTKTLVNSSSGSAQILCYWDGVIDDDLIKWDQTLPFVATSTGANGTITGSSQALPTSSNTVNITVKKPGISITLSPQNYTRRDMNIDGNYPYDQVMGRIAITNHGPSNGENLRYEFSFSQNLHVRAFTMPGANTDGKVKVTAVTNKRTISDLAITIPFTTYDSHEITPTMLGLESDEYLLSATVIQEKLTVGAYNTEPYQGTNPIIYYGRYQNGESGDVTISIYDANDNLLATATDRTKIGWENSAGINLNLQARQDSYSGSAVLSFTPDETIYFTGSYGNNTATRITDNHGNDIVDPDFYVSLPAGIDLDVNSMQVYSTGGNNGTSWFDLVAGSNGVQTETINGAEWTTYHFKVANPNDIRINGVNFYASHNNRIQIRFTANVSSICKTYTSLEMKDILMLDLGKTAVNAANSGKFVVADVNEWAGKGASYGLIGATSSNNLNVYQKPGFNVSLGIRTKSLSTSDPYYTYNGTEASIAPVTPDTNAQIWLKYENTSTDTYYAGSEIYLPIPKKEVDYDRIFDNNNISDPINSPSDTSSEWTSVLTGEIILPGFTTYYAALTGDTNANDGGGGTSVTNNWTPIGSTGDWVTSAGIASIGGYGAVTMVKFVADVDIAPNGQPGSTGETVFEIAVDNSALLGKVNYWRSYQKGWTDDGTSAEGPGGAWIYGSVLAASPAMAGATGMVFEDKNANGSMDSGEAYTALSGVSAVLTGGGINPLNITVNADGSFDTLNADGTRYYLKTGTYTITINDSNAQRGFTTATSGTHSTLGSPDVWFMDIKQADIAANHSSATYTFTVSASTLSTQPLGVGLLNASKVTYQDDGATAAADGSSASFASVEEYRNHEQQPSSSVVPTAAAVRVAGYDPNTAKPWTANVAVTLSDGTVVSAGTKMTRAEVLSAKITTDVVFTMKLDAFIYSVSYEGPLGTTVMPSGDKIMTGWGDTSSLVPVLEPKLTGHTFLRWELTERNGSDIGSANYLTVGSQTYAALTGTTPDDTVTSLTLVAVFSLNEHDVTYSYTNTAPTGAPLASSFNESDVEYGAEVTVATKPVVAGYTLSDWTTTSAGVSIVAGKFDMPDNNVAFTATWSANTTTPYKVEHYKVDHLGVPSATADDTDNKTGTTGAAATYTAKDYTGYTLDLSFSGTVATANIAGDGSTTLKLYYTANTNTAYKVQHYKVDHLGTPSATPDDTDNETGTTGAAATYTAKNYQGYTLDTSYPGTVAIATIAADGSTTLKLYYTANVGTEYRVEHYKVNALGVPSLTADDTDTRYGTTGAAATYTAKNYTGYTLDTTFTGTVASASIAANGSTILKLYYPINTYAVSYSYSNTAPSGALDPTTLNQTSVAYSSEVTVATTPAVDSVPGYTFSGWAPSSGISAGDISSGKFAMPDNAVAFTGSWSANSNTAYKVEHYKVNSMGVPSATADDIDNKTGTTGTAATYTAKVYPGYTLDLTFTGTIATANIAGNGSTTLKLYYTANTNTPYKVHHHKVNSLGAITSTATENKTGTTDTLTAAITPKDYTGYTYEAAYSGPAGTPRASANIAGDGSTELHFFYVANSYTVSYTANGGTGTTASQTVYYDEDFTAAQNGFSRAGYTFRNWNTQADGRGTMYTAGQVTTWTLTNGLTLHAIWDANTGTAYRVEHYLVGTSGAPSLDYTENRTGTTDTTAYAAARAYTGYTFNGGYPGTVASGNINGSGTLVLKLYYQINYYTVTFVDYNGATLASRSVPHGGSALAPADPTRLGYTFTGWDRGYTNVTSNITVNATYTPLTYTITFLGYNDTVLQTSTVNHGESVTPPANPTRNGHRFTGWDKPSSAWTNVTADATVRAMWNDETVTTTPGTETTTTPTGGGTTTIAEDMAAAAEEQGIPNIGIPLAAPTGFAAWALANLILATLGIVMALVFFVLRRFRKNDEVDEQEREERKRAYAEQAQWTNANGEEVEEEPLRKRRGIGWLIGCIVLALAGVVLFILTQDISLPMVWVDIWTIVQAIILIVSVVLGNFAIGRKKQKQEEDEQPTAPEAV